MTRARRPKYDLEFASKSTWMPWVKLEIRTPLPLERAHRALATRLKRGVFRGYMRDYEFRLLRGHGRGPMRINGAFHLQGEQVVVKVTLRMSWFMYVAYLPYLACFFGVTLFALLRKGVNAIPFGPIVPVGLLGWICLISIGFRASALKVERILLRTFGIRAPDDEEEEDS